MRVKLLGFTVPNYVLQEMPPGSRQAGFTEGPKYALSDVDAEDLASLCEHFRSEVFRKAGKADPRALTSAQEPRR